MYVQRTKKHIFNNNPNLCLKCNATLDIYIFMYVCIYLYSIKTLRCIFSSPVLQKCHPQEGNKTETATLQSGGLPALAVCDEDFK